MGMREKIEERIKKKSQEIKGFEYQIREAQTYIQAMQDALKLVPRDEAQSGSNENLLRVGSVAHKAMLALKVAKAPMHVNELLKALGLTNTKSNRILLGGTLSRYVRVGKIFSRPHPNTFGLASQTSREEPPENFGIDPTDGLVPGTAADQFEDDDA